MPKTTKPIRGTKTSAARKAAPPSTTAKKTAPKKAVTKKAGSKKSSAAAAPRKRPAKKGPIKKAEANKKSAKKQAPKKMQAMLPRKQVASQGRKAAKRQSGSEVEQVVDRRKQRLKVYVGNLKKPSATFRGETLGDLPVDVLAFKKKVGNDKGYLLITNGLSDQRAPQRSRSKPAARVELCWFTRDVTPSKAKFLYQVATQPWRSKQTIQFGSFVSPTEPPERGSAAKDVMFLHPITLTEKLMHTELALLVGFFELLVVHVLMPKEFASVKRSARNFDRFLDLLDANRYPLFFDPKRPSYV